MNDQHTEIDKRENNAIISIHMNIHKWQTLWCGRTFSSNGGIMLTASCLLMLPWNQPEMNTITLQYNGMHKLF